MSQFNSVEEIKEEHRVIWNMLDILETIIMLLEKHRLVDVIYLKKVVDFLTNYIDRFHQSAEEKALLPIIEKTENFDGKEAAQWILREHGFGTEYLGKIAREVEYYKTSPTASSIDIVGFLRNYEYLYRLHIAKENNLFFDVVVKNLTPDLEIELNKKFEEVEAETIGRNNKNKYYEIVKELKQIYLKLEI